jgi:hypothetical protein
VAFNASKDVNGSARSGFEVSVPQTAAAVEEGLIGPTIGRSGYGNWQEFGDAALTRYQGFYDQADAIVQRQVAAGNIANDPLTIGRVTDAQARDLFRDWLASEGMTYNGPGAAVRVNSRLYDPLGSGAYRIPDIRIPGANLIFDGTLATSPAKSALSPQILDFRSFSGGNNVVIVQPTRLGGSYGVVFP